MILILSNLFFKINFCNLKNSRNESFDVEELLQTLPKKEHERLWAGLQDMTHRVILTSPLSSQENADFESDEEGSVSENSTCIYDTSNTN